MQAFEACNTKTFFGEWTCQSYSRDGGNNDERFKKKKEISKFQTSHCSAFAEFVES